MKELNIEQEQEEFEPLNIKGYQCDEQGYFLYETLIQGDPIANEPVLHLNETDVEILAEKSGYVRKFDFNQEKWEYVENHKGEKWYSKETGEKVEITEYGKVADNLTDKEPLPYSKWNEEKDDWLIDDDLVAQAVASKKEELKQLTESKVSSLINTTREYTAFDQQRLEAQIWTLDNSNPVPLLTSISKTIGMPLPELVKKCLEKTDEQSEKKGVLIGQEVKFKQRIKKATKLEQLDKIEQEIIAWK